MTPDEIRTALERAVLHELQRNILLDAVSKIASSHDDPNSTAQTLALIAEKALRDVRRTLARPLPR